MKKTICMFPGQGSQFCGMGKDAAVMFPEFALTFEEASDTVGYDMSDLCFNDPKSQLNLTEFTQPCILTASVATWRVLRERTGIQPVLFAGHSLGEYSALVAAGALKFPEALRAVRLRGQAMQRAVPVGTGSMAAYIGSKGEEVLNLCRSISNPSAVVEVVNFNSPSQYVLSGHKAGVDLALQKIQEAKLGKAVPLSVSAPFHSSLMKPAADEMEKYFAAGALALSAQHESICANVDAKVYKAGEYAHALLTKQIASAVLWTQSLAEMAKSADESTTWLEVGPGQVLQGLLRKTLPQVQTIGTGDITQIQNLLKSV